jgi:hypothetical protein
MPLKAIKIKFSLPWIGEIGGEWEPDESEVKAAWELYVELVTRISVVELKPGQGLLREALGSLYFCRLVLQDGTFFGSAVPHFESWPSRPPYRI